MQRTKRPVVIIDPGHGGVAPRGRSTPYGVTGPGGTQEKAVNLDLSRRLANRLGAVAQVRLTRAADDNRSLSERIGAARNSEARVFLSIHADRRPGERPGPHLWVHDHARSGSVTLAGNLCETLGDAGAPIHAGPIAVLDPHMHASGTAACLLEVDDLSSSVGEQRLRDPTWLDALATEIADGLRGFLQPLAYGRPGAAYGNPGELLVPYDQMVRGIDVSHWNSGVDWAQVAGDGVGFAYIKATEGRTFVDDRFAENWAGAQAAGIPKGAYHVLREPTSSHVDDQVRNFLDTVTHSEGDLPPALDVELRNLRAIVQDFRDQGASRSEAREQARQWLLSWLEPVHAAVGMAPILYIGRSSVIHQLAHDAGGLTAYGLWYPRYRREPNLPEDRHGNMVWPHFTIWQKTSSGSVAGVRGNVDVNLFNGDPTMFEAWRGGTRGRPLALSQRYGADPQIPASVASGDKLAVVLPGGHLSTAKADKGAERIADALGTILSPGVATKNLTTGSWTLGGGGSTYSVGGTDSDRLDQLVDALTNPDYSAVLCGRGGYGSMRLLDGLAARLQGRNPTPRWLVGYSDITALHLFAYFHLGWASLHGPMPTDFKTLSSLPGSGDKRVSLDTLAQRLTQSLGSSTYDKLSGDASLASTYGRIVQGFLVGGNLSLVEAMYGSPYCPSLSGCILVLEEVNEAVYRIDRMLRGLELRGAAREVEAVILGYFADADADAVADLIAHWNKPVLTGFPCGHNRHPNLAWQHGVHHVLDLDNAGTSKAKLTPGYFV